MVQFLGLVDRAEVVVNERKEGAGYARLVVLTAAGDFPVTGKKVAALWEDVIREVGSWGAGAQQAMDFPEADRKVVGFGGEVAGGVER